MRNVKSFESDSWVTCPGVRIEVSLVIATFERLPSILAWNLHASTVRETVLLEKLLDLLQNWLCAENPMTVAKESHAFVSLF